MLVLNAFVSFFLRVKYPEMKTKSGMWKNQIKVINIRLAVLYLRSAITCPNTTKTMSTNFSPSKKVFLSFVVVMIVNVFYCNIMPKCNPVREQQKNLWTYFELKLVRPSTIANP